MSDREVKTSKDSIKMSQCPQARKISKQRMYLPALISVFPLAIVLMTVLENYVDSVAATTAGSIFVLGFTPAFVSREPRNSHPLVHLLNQWGMSVICGLIFVFGHSRSNDRSTFLMPSIQILIQGVVLGALSLSLGDWIGNAMQWVFLNVFHYQ